MDNGTRLNEGAPFQAASAERIHCTADIVASQSLFFPFTIGIRIHIIGFGLTDGGREEPGTEPLARLWKKRKADT
jgi:hypothetical protein